MTTHPLNDLTPELIRDFEHHVKHDESCGIGAFAFLHQHLILECMKTALRLKNDLDKMERNE